MALATFRAALDFTARIERAAWAAGCPPIVYLSGGEATEHPRILDFITAIEERGGLPGLLTNGHWLDNAPLRDAILAPGRRIFVQLTYDARFYPRPPPVWNDPRIVPATQIQAIVPLGRGKRESVRAQAGQRLAPTSFNLRSITRSLGSFTAAVTVLRMRASVGMAGHCTPSVSADGSVHVGETRYCYRIGDVGSSDRELTNAVLAMGSCNRCGLETGLTDVQRNAIGVEHAREATT